METRNLSVTTTAGTYSTTATITPGTSAQYVVIPTGYVSNQKVTVEGDADLISANIKSGANIFGVAGDTNVINTASSTAPTAAQILSGKVAYANGSKITGSMATVNMSVTATAGSLTNKDTVTPGTAAKYVVIPTGYVSGQKVTVNGDSNLTAANIKSGVGIFGVTGTYSGSIGMPWVTGSFTKVGSPSLPTSSSVSFYIWTGSSNYDGEPAVIRYAGASSSFTSKNYYADVGGSMGLSSYYDWDGITSSNPISFAMASIGLWKVTISSNSSPIPPYTGDNHFELNLESNTTNWGDGIFLFQMWVASNNIQYRYMFVK